MSTTKYIIRLDDACPYMDRQRWDKIEHILDRLNIKPLIGIIPNNEDGETIIEPEDSEFWEKAKKWEVKGWSIALHGFNHCYASKNGGINPIHSRSEFAGLSYEDQLVKIKNGYDILIKHGLTPKFFFAPSHTYDKNTVKAIKSATPIRIISDTMSRYPYRYDEDFVIVPCQMGKFRNIPVSGYWTFCFHPNIMKENEFYDFENFIAKNKDKFISIEDIPLQNISKRKLIDKCLNLAYIGFRKIRQ